MARRKPVTAQVKQKISRALKGKKRKSPSSNKKKATIGLGVAGGLGLGALALQKAKDKNTKTSPRLLEGRPKPSPKLLEPDTKAPKEWEAGYNGFHSTKEELKKAHQENLSRRWNEAHEKAKGRFRKSGGGVGRKERITRDPKQNTKRGLNISAIKKRFKK